MLRVVGDLVGSAALRQAGAITNALALLAFVLVMVGTRIHRAVGPRFFVKSPRT